MRVRCGRVTALFVLLAAILLVALPARGDGRDAPAAEGVRTSGSASPGSVSGTVVDKYTRQPLFPADIVIVGIGIIPNVEIAEELSDVAAIEQQPNREGRTMLMVLAPDTKKGE
mgnify:CR=1 FL=1